MGETFTLVVTPAKGYKMQSLTVTHATRACAMSTRCAT